MKNLIKSNLLKRVAVAIIALFAIILILPVTVVSQKAYAYNYSAVPTGENHIGNLFKANNKFDLDNLDALALKVKDENGNSIYSSAEEMAAEAERGTIRTSADFGNTVVDFGSFTFKENPARELTWIPVYLSKSGNDAILTLWLSDTQSVNGAVSNQEKSSFSDGTYSGSDPKVIDGTTSAYSNSYEYSYIHNYVLNGNTNFVSNWGPGASKANNLPTDMTKFTQLTSGALSEYIVTPNEVDWQKNSDILRNDPKYSFSGVAEYYTAENWLNDKLWLPSIYEVYDNTLTSNTNINSANFAENGGLWQTGGSDAREKRANVVATWLRSALYNTFWSSGFNFSGYSDILSVEVEFAVRPAIHLNLSKALKNAENSHTHSYGEWINEVPATCTQDGTKGHYICSICHRYFDADHNLITNLTLTGSGEHDWGGWAHNGNDVNHTRGCSKCTETQSQPHTFPETWITDSEATEGAAGSKHRNCTVCEYSQTDTIPQLPHTHKYDNLIAEKPATCTENGKKKHYLCTCGKCFDDNHEEITDLTILSSGHELVTDEAKAPTCTETGLTEGKHCTKCDYKIEQTVIPANGHTWGEWKTTTPATEEREGLKEHECSVCNEKQTEDIPVLGHTHKFASVWTSDENNHWHAATCGHDVKDGNAPHSWNGGEVTTPATCTATGEKTYTCTVCGKTRTESVDKVAHDLEHHEAQDATCTEKGWNAYDTCKNCDYTTYKEIPAKGHSEVIDEAKAPTCTETGLTEGKHCSVCEAIIITQTEIPANGHSYEWQITKQPTKDETGLKKNICTVCDDIDGEEVIAKLVSDEGGKGDVVDLPPYKEYDLDIEVRETNESYSLKGINRGYAVKLWVVEGENKEPYDSNKVVTLSLVLPEGMSADNFKLYKRLLGGDYEPIEDYIINGRIVTIKTTLSAEFVFNAPAPAEPKAGIPWWIWLIVAVGGVAIIAVVIVLIKKKKGGNGNNGGNVIAVSDNGEVLERLGKQDKKIDKLIEITDGGFNDIADDE